MESALKTSEDTVVDLQREVMTLKARLEVAKLASPAKKRKKIDEDSVPYPRSPKRAKPGAPSARGGGLGTLDSFPEADFNQAGEIGKYFQITVLSRQGHA